MFRLLSLQPLTPQPSEPCMKSESSLAGLDLIERMPYDGAKAEYASVHKGLIPGQMYWFYRGYKLRGEKIVCEDDRNKHLYGDKISVCAIVGENGSGKSTVIELVIRLMNNAAYALRTGYWHEGTAAENELKHIQHFVTNVYARLFFETDDGIYSITQLNHILIIQKQGTTADADCNLHYIYASPLPTDLVTKSKAKKHLQKLFYTIVVNYAAYAYNIYDYRAEWTDPLERTSPELAKENGEILSEERSSDENLCWLGAIFHKNDGYQMPIVLNPFRSRGNINYNNEKTLFEDRILTLIRLVPTSQLTEILQGKEPDSFILDENSEYNEMVNAPFASNRVIGILYDLNLLPESKSMWTIEAKSFGERIISAWEQVLGVQFQQTAADRSDYHRALNYLVYKTLKITQVYEDYRIYRKCWTDKNSSIVEYITKLAETDNHITRKIRKTLAFLHFQHYGTSLHGRDSHVIKITDYLQNVSTCISKDKGGVISWTEEDLMPAPCFHTDIWFKLADGKGIKFSQLSSGEKQMLELVCTILYHLMNLHGIKKEGDNHIGYENVNIMIDEIELYFHPRYQTQLLKFLIDAINRLGLDTFRGINILIATHSPYLLSDIPLSNILRLKAGVPLSNDGVNETFGANVYNILRDQFFMSQFVGGFSAEKINQLVRSIVDASQLQKAERNRLRKEVKLIGDTYIRNALLQKLDLYDQGAV